MSPHGYTGNPFLSSTSDIVHPSVSVASPLVLIKVHKLYVNNMYICIYIHIYIYIYTHIYVYMNTECEVLSDTNLVIEKDWSVHIIFDFHGEGAVLSKVPIFLGKFINDFSN